MTEIQIHHGDITKLQVCAIVNAANSSLLGGGGVDGAIHQAAGPKLLKACQEIRKTTFPDGLPTGQAIATPGFNLPSQWVIHTVGPIWRGGLYGEPESLFNTYFNSLKVALNLDSPVKSIAFPAISTGVYGYPITQAREIEKRAIDQFLNSNPNAFEKIVLVRYP